MASTEDQTDTTAVVVGTPETDPSGTSAARASARPRRSRAKATAAAADLTRPLAGTAVAAALTDAGRANLTRLYDDPELVAQALALYEAPASVGGADRDIEVRTDINFRCGAGALARLTAPQRRAGATNSRTAMSRWEPCTSGTSNMCLA